MEISPFDDNLVVETQVDDHVDDAVEFLFEHKEKVAEVLETINKHVAEAADSEFDPIGLFPHTIERVKVFELVNSEDDLSDKLIIVFASICDQIDYLQEYAHHRLYGPLSLFGMSPLQEPEDEFEDGELELYMGRALPLFQEVGDFIEACAQVLLNAVHQLAMFYEGTVPLSDVALRPVFDSLSALLRVLMLLDSIVLQNDAIQPAWERYLALHSAAIDDEANPLTDKKEVFAEMLQTLDHSVMKGAMFKYCIEQDFEVEPQGGGRVQVRQNPAFLAKLKTSIISGVDECYSMIGSPDESDEPLRLVGYFGLYALYRILCPPSQKPESDLFKKLWSTQTRLPLVALHGRVVFHADEFLNENCPLKIGKKVKLSPSDPDKHRLDAAAKVGAAFPGLIERHDISVKRWLVEAEQSLMQLTAADRDAAKVGNAAKATSDVLRDRSLILQSGLRLIHRISRLVYTFIALHISTETPIRKSVLPSLCKGIELLKVMEFGFRRKMGLLAECASTMLRYNTRKVLAICATAVRSFRRKPGPGQAISKGAFTVVHNLIVGTESWSATRRHVVNVALELALRKATTTVKDAEITTMREQMREIELLSTWVSFLSKAVDTSTLFWVRALLPAMIHSVVQVPWQADRLRLLIAGFSDASSLLGTAKHLAPVDPTRVLEDESDKEPLEARDRASLTAQDLLTGYRERLLDVLQEEIVTPVCRQVEEDLRIHVHSVHMSHLSPPSAPRSSNYENVLAILDTEPMRVMNADFHIKKRVISYLERTFYNLTSVALHDWRTYSEMTALAAQKYGLDMEDNHLPMGGLDQGIDILVIMEQIHVFVARYNYNLNMQFFVEKKPFKGAKHLNIVSIDSICGSIRQHGSGMMNTTVNYVYGYINRKFNIFSQFLFDEHIKSFLSAERRWFRKNRTEIDNRYPMSRAEQLKDKIKGLGVGKDNLSYLDKFRQLISEIGNALGFVRMVRSAAMQQSAAAIQFVPDLAHIPSFKDAVTTGCHTGVTEEASSKSQAKATSDAEDVGGEGEERSTAEAKDEVRGTKGLSEMTVEAAELLDEVVSSLVDRFSQNTDFMKLLVTVFEEVVGENSQHTSNPLRNFCFMVPALMTNFIDHIRIAKDSINKSVKGKEAFFTDDGFPIGVAFLLAVLGQNPHFAAIHWFDAVDQYFRADAQEIQTQRSRTTKKEKDVLQELEYKMRRIQARKREFDALFYAFSGAKIFFKRYDEDTAAQLNAPISSKVHREGAAARAAETAGPGGGGGEGSAVVST